MTADESGKGGMAADEKGQRDYRETYGRGGGESFEDRDYPQSYGTPEAMDWRRALRAYVGGHDRGWGAERKHEQAEAEAEGGVAPDEGHTAAADARAVGARGRPGEPSPGAGGAGEPPPPGAEAAPSGAEAAPAGEEATPPDAEADPSDAEATPSDAEATDAATARTEEGTRFGVPVPDRHQLRFHRGASMWRDRLPDARRLPRHTDRRLDTDRGRGGQA